MDPLDADGVVKLLEARYAWPDYIFATEFPYRAEDGRNRLADAVAVPTYASRNYELHVFEVKVSRADWLRELSDGAKAHPEADRLWLAVGHSDVAKPDELPAGWGLLAPYGSGIRVLKQAKPMHESRPQWDRAFVVQPARKAHKAAWGRYGVNEREVFERGRQAALDQLARQGNGEYKASETLKAITKATNLWFMQGGEKDDVAFLERVWKVGTAVIGDHRYSEATQYAERLERAAQECIEHAKRLREALATVEPKPVEAT